MRILLNEGLDSAAQLKFREAFFFPMYGAYKAFARDFDEDGDLDIDLVLGSYLDGPREAPAKLSQQWDIRGSAALYF